MAFTRKFLIEHGAPEDQVDAIMAERNRTLQDYIPRADVQAQIDEALKAAKPEPQDPTQSEAYLKLAAKAAKLEAFGGEDFRAVKAPYRDIVWEKLDHAEKHKPYAEQLTELQAQLPDLFAAQPAEGGEPQKPSFGAPLQGSIPSGKTGPSFADNWDFIPKK
ncbi:MAG: hypothetical protein IKF99_10375 [Oscillospiraceae bacterium]|nr:hypothetical protein [Oscillospiraceae bacterium]